MSMGEVLLVLLVALLVFGPQKLPMLAEHLGQLLRCITGYKQQLASFWEQQRNELSLQENIKKAKKVDAEYAKDVTAYPFPTSRGLSAGSSAPQSFLDPADNPRDVGVVDGGELCPRESEL